MRKIAIIESDHKRITFDIAGVNDLADLFYSLVREIPRVIILEIPDIGIFTLGVGRSYGFVQYSRDGTPPYLVATNDVIAEQIDIGDEAYFDADGTPTPISKHHCLPYNQIVSIIEYCFKNRELPRKIPWEEV